MSTTLYWRIKSPERQSLPISLKHLFQQTPYKLTRELLEGVWLAAQGEDRKQVEKLLDALSAGHEIVYEVE